jgi:ribonuclease P protein component
VAELAFPRAARLLTPDGFSRALKTRPIRGKFLWIHRVDLLPVDAEHAPEIGESLEASETLDKPARRPQLGMMIAKRNAKSAVLRNAIKRRIREQFRLRQAGLPARAYVARLATTANKLDLPLIVGEWVNFLDIENKKKTPYRPIILGSTA